MSAQHKESSIPNNNITGLFNGYNPYNLLVNWVTGIEVINMDAYVQWLLLTMAYSLVNKSVMHDAAAETGHKIMMITEPFAPPSSTPHPHPLPS